MSELKPRVLAIDATNRIHALWHGTQGEGAADLFFRQLDLIIEKLQPTWVVACFDQPSFRKKLDPGYKSGRVSNPDVAQLIVEIKTRLALNPDVPVCEADGMEADDLLASFAASATASGYQTILLTADKDCRQCLRAGTVTMIKDVKIRQGKIELQFETAEKVEERFGVAPEKWTQYQTLVGDGGDDIVGAEGVGPKTAAILLDRVGDLATILAQPERCPVSKNVIINLKRFRARADLVKQLVTLKTDIEVSHWLA